MVQDWKFENRLIVTNFSRQTNCLQSTICVEFEHYVVNLSVFGFLCCCLKKRPKQREWRRRVINHVLCSFIQMLQLNELPVSPLLHYKRRAFKKALTFIAPQRGKLPPSIQCPKHINYRLSFLQSGHIRPPVHWPMRSQSPRV